MSTVVVRRPSRKPSPDMPSGELVLEPPPEIPAPSGRQWTQVLTFLPMLAIMAAMMLMFSGSMGGSIRYVVFGLFGVAMLAMVVVGLLGAGGANKQEMGNARRAYLRGLAQQRIRLLRGVRKQQDAMRYLHPEPAALISLVGSYRLWERRPADADFAVARIGSGPQSPALRLVPPEAKPLEQLEPLSAVALRRFLRTYNAVPDLPLALAVTGFARIYLRGERHRTLGLARALIGQLGSLHAPDDIRVAVCAGPEQLPDWDWLKWLPHALHPDKTDAAGAMRLVAPGITGIEAILEDVLASRPRFDPDSRRRIGTHLVVFLDGGDLAGSDHLLGGGGLDGVSIVDMTVRPPRVVDRSSLVLDINDEGRFATTTFDGSAEMGRADSLAAATAEALARQLAPLRLTGARGEQALSHDFGLAELLDLGDPHAFDPDATWVQRPNRDRLRVRFGIRSDGTPIEVDLKESAQDGMGPHGLLIGATGSGKSELLRTLVLSLAITHPPNALNFTLIDFKGGATFTKLDRLPHTSAVITNLADELPLVDRMTDALNGELIRRQELLRAAGDYASLRDYERARAAGAPLDEVPTLLVICDEFSELLSAKPDFIDTFVQIGRVGRSLGVHLLLASQRLEEGRLRGLDTHLSYRIGLRTFSAMDSRTVLDVTDAFELPRAPGHGFLKFSTEPMERFRSAYVSGVHHRAGSGGAQQTTSLRNEIVGYGTGYAPRRRAPEEAEPVPEDEEIGESLLDVLVDRLTGRGTPAHQVWLPPLDESPTMPDLLGQLAGDHQRGWHAPEAPGGLRAIIGVVDRPFEQRREALEFDLSAGGGHAVVVGGPRSGKSTGLRTLITSLALTRTPAEVQFYCLDFGGGALASLRGLPHVGGVSARQNTGAVRRTVAQLASLLAERERRFAEHDVDGIAAYRTARAAGEFADDPYGDVFLVVDGWQTLRKEFEDVEETVCDIAARGLAYGVHVIATCSRMFEMRPAVRDLFVSKVELRLGDPIDTMIDRIGALNVPERAPGRGLATSQHQVLLGLPVTDESPGTDLQTASAALVRNIAEGWRGAPAPKVRLLPNTLPYAELPSRDEWPLLSIGISEQDLLPARLDFAADPHFLVLGDAQAGKTAFLRTVAKRIVDGCTPQQARILLIDHRRGLLGDVTTAHLLGYGTDAVSTRGLVDEAARGMAERLPGPGITPEQLRKRNWWAGPELFVLIDDYDLVAGLADNPFAPLLDYLPQGRDIGLHVVLTRRTGGAGRGLFEPFLSRVRDVGSPGLLMSGDKDEGPLLGGIKPDSLPPGRGRLIKRGRPPELLQVAWTPPAD